MKNIENIEQLKQDLQIHYELSFIHKILIKDRIDIIHLILEYYKKLTNDDTKIQFLQLLINIANADGILSFSENHILRLAADILEIDKNTFESIYSKITNRKIEEPVDLTETLLRKRRDNLKNDFSSERTFSRRELDLQLLGLPFRANANEIKKAYKLKAHEMHPDKFENISPEAKLAANYAFIKLQEAYERLIET